MVKSKALKSTRKYSTEKCLKALRIGYNTSSQLLKSTRKSKSTQEYSKSASEYLKTLTSTERYQVPSIAVVKSTGDDQTPLAHPVACVNPFTTALQHVRTNYLGAVWVDFFSIKRVKPFQNSMHVSVRSYLELEWTLIYLS